MIKQFLIFLLTLFFSSLLSESFKESQLKYSRVQQAYRNKESRMLGLLKNERINRNELKIYLRAFKAEQEIELWGKNISEAKFSLIKTYKVCKTSGGLGPKRKQGDLQIPEGFYHLNRFNPISNYHLSLGINYPNKSDRILGVKDKLGGDIFIHGACVTIGCLPITDDQIEELYVFCIEARNNGQLNIPITIFPARLDDKEYQRLIDTYNSHYDKIGLWTDLARAYQIFNETKQLPTIGFLNSGRHRVNR